MGKRKINIRESVSVVTADNFLKAAGLENISLKAKKLLYLVLTQCNKTDKDSYEYNISAAEFVDLMGVNENNMYKEVDSLTDELMKGFITLTVPGKKKFVKFVIFEKCCYSKESISFTLSESMSPLLLKLKKDIAETL